MVSVNSHKEFLTWLNARPVETRKFEITILATRFVNRVFPLVNVQTSPEFMLILFRGMASSRLACDKTNHTINLLDVIRTNPIKRAGTFEPVSSNLGLLIADTVASAKAYSNDSANFNDIAEKVSFGANMFQKTEYSSYFWSELGNDLNYLESGKAAEILLARPLWAKGTPDWFNEAWTNLRTRLLANSDENWQVWTNRFGLLINGFYPAQNWLELENEILSLPKDVWEQGAAVVNQRIVDIQTGHAQDKSAEVETSKPFVFLSYSQKNREMVDVIRRGLIHEGIDCWWDGDIKNGQVWADEISQKLKDAKLIVTFWTADSVESKAVREEARFGLQDLKLLQFVYGEARPTYGFSEHQWVNANVNRPLEIIPRIAEEFRNEKTDASRIIQEVLDTTPTNEVFAQNEDGKVSRVVEGFSKPDILKNAVRNLEYFLEDVKGTNQFPEDDRVLNRIRRVLSDAPDDALALYDAAQMALKVVGGRIRNQTYDATDEVVLLALDTFSKTCSDCGKVDESIADIIQARGEFALDKIIPENLQKFLDSVHVAEAMADEDLSASMEEDKKAISEFVPETDDVSIPVLMQADFAGDVGRFAHYQFQMALYRETSRLVRMWKLFDASGDISKAMTLMGVIDLLLKALAFLG